MSTQKRYQLNEIFMPMIINSKINKDPGMGGVKLVYQQSDPTLPLTRRDIKVKIFLKPYKEIFGKKEDCKKGEFGNTNSPLTSMWFEIISGDYTNYEKDIYSIRAEKITDQQLIAHLNKQDKDFILGEDLFNPTKVIKLSLRQKIRLFAEIQYDKFCPKKSIVSK